MIPVTEESGEEEPMLIKFHLEDDSWHELYFPSITFTEMERRLRNHEIPAEGLDWGEAIVMVDDGFNLGLHTATFIQDNGNIYLN